MSTRRRALIPVVTIVWALIIGPSAASADSLTIVFSGMIGFAPAQKAGRPDGVVAALVNGSNKGLYQGMTHFPALELNCEDLTDDDTLKAICSFLPVSPASNGRHALNLDRGFDITIAGTSGDVSLADSRFLNSVIQLAAITFLPDYTRTIHHSIRKARPDGELAGHAIVRVMLRGGAMMGDDLLKDPRGEYAFFSADATASKTFSGVANGVLYRSATLTAPIVLQLRSYDGAGNRDIKFKRTTTIAIVNEPTLADFCRHEPTREKPKVEHFNGIFALSEADDLLSLPVPTALTPTKQCDEGGQGGREPIICMSALYPGFSYDQ